MFPHRLSQAHTLTHASIIHLRTIPELTLHRSLTPYPMLPFGHGLCTNHVNTFYYPAGAHANILAGGATLPLVPMTKQEAGGALRSTSDQPEEPPAHVPQGMKTGYSH